MVKQLCESQENYLKGLLDGGSNYRSAQIKFQYKFGRKVSLDTIYRVANRQKITNYIRKNQFSRISTARENRQSGKNKPL